MLTIFLNQSNITNSDNSFKFTYYLINNLKLFVFINANNSIKSMKTIVYHEIF